MTYVYDDGGRKAAGFRGETRDCVTRAIAIGLQRDYQTVYDGLNALAQLYETRKVKRSASRTGVHRGIYQRYLFSHGATWHATMAIGSGCQAHLRNGEIPMSGRLVVVVSRHLVAVIDGVVHDTHDPSRDGSRCVYGYYTLPR